MSCGLKINSSNTVVEMSCDECGYFYKTDGREANANSAADRAAKRHIETTGHSLSVCVVSTLSAGRARALD